MMSQIFVKDHTPRESKIIQCIKSYLMAWYDEIDEVWTIDADDCAEGIMLDLEYNGWEIKPKDSK